eukprot:7151587-Pyramimonas_sp.AAC.1
MYFPYRDACYHRTTVRTSPELAPYGFCECVTGVVAFLEFSERTVSNFDRNLFQQQMATNVVVENYQLRPQPLPTTDGHQRGGRELPGAPGMKK